MNTKYIFLVLQGMTVAVLLIAGTAFAASNPSGTGQPGAPSIGCGAGTALMEPNGFMTAGFTNATAVYAGSSGTPSLANAQSSHAISQYDVACYQQTQKP